MGKRVSLACGYRGRRGSGNGGGPDSLLLPSVCVCGDSLMPPSVCARGDGRLFFSGDLYRLRSAKITQIRTPIKTGTKQATSRIHSFSAKRAAIGNIMTFARWSSNVLCEAPGSPRINNSIIKIPTNIAIEHKIAINHNLLMDCSLRIVNALTDNE